MQGFFLTTSTLMYCSFSFVYDSSVPSNALQLLCPLLEITHFGIDYFVISFSWKITVSPGRFAFFSLSPHDVDRSFPLREGGGNVVAVALSSFVGGVRGHGVALLVLHAPECFLYVKLNFVDCST